jgi:hypothetical protein
MDTKGFNVKVVDNFLSLDECSNILSFVESLPEWETTGGLQGFWDNRTLSNEFIYRNHSKELGLELLNIRGRIGREIETLYNIEKIYSDHLSVIRWFPGISLEPHIDDMSDSVMDGSEWYHHREFGAVLYLNDNFESGYTYYPNFDVEIKPKAGTLVLHPGDEVHRHGVRASRNGNRYTISSFWTQDVTYSDEWISRYE